MMIMQVIGIDHQLIGWAVRCPACEENDAGPHVYHHPAWTLTGGISKPSFIPSFRMQMHRAGTAYVCHSFLIDGRLQYLPDCTHSRAGEVVDVPAWDGELRPY